ncbi:MAG: hydroxymethylglutaryl-CoA lyase [Motiliproteus sp.]
MNDLPAQVLLEDESLRDGLQSEKLQFSVEQKLHFIKGMEASGVRRIQVGSFVHPKWVPQMANTDELFAQLERTEGVTYTALVLNQRGVKRAVSAQVPHLSMSISASETHNQKNTNRSLAQAMDHIGEMIEIARSENIRIRAGIIASLGCAFEGRIPKERVCEIAELYASLGVEEINLADSAGLANPRWVYEMVMAVREVVGDRAGISLHLHDTRGLGLANMVAGLQAGVTTFDASLGGLGGCPYIPGATGNIATEDAAYMLGEMGIETGIDWQQLGKLTMEMESLLDRRLPGRIAHLS